MFNNIGSVQIMWKEIFIFWVVVFFVRIIIDVYIVSQYNYIIKNFYSNNFTEAMKKIYKVKKICDIFSRQKLNKKICLMYNNICCVIASIALLYNQDDVFLSELTTIKKEINYEMKPFMIALYYLSKKDNSHARVYYENYLLCNHENENIKVIMEHFFSLENCKQNDTVLKKACKSFNNPAILKLLKDVTGTQVDGSLTD